jgi:transcriptional regulator with XRE-family HTH domain
MVKKKSTVEEPGEKDEFLVAIGKRVKEVRLAAGWTQRQVGDAAGLTSTYVYLIEGGVQNISVVVLKRIATALGVSFGALLPIEECGSVPTDDLLLRLAETANRVTEALAIRRGQDEEMAKESKTLSQLGQQLIDLASHRSSKKKAEDESDAHALERE